MEIRNSILLGHYEIDQLIDILGLKNDSDFADIFYKLTPLEKEIFVKNILDAIEGENLRESLRYLIIKEGN